MEYIALDVHKRYTWARVETPAGQALWEGRLAHERGQIRELLCRWETNSPVALETVGNWYWLVDEIEASGMNPCLVNARLAKVMMGCVNKTDKLDARGLNRLQRVGTLPTVWIPPADVRDARELPRTRMTLAGRRTQLKNRIHATLDKYNLRVQGVSDAFGKQGRIQIEALKSQLPPHTATSLEVMLSELDHVGEQLKRIEDRMEEVFGPSRESDLVRSVPGIGKILAVVVCTEVGTVERFARAEQFASYSGTTPRIEASGGKVRHGRIRRDVNLYLKWAFIEAANSAVLNRWRCGYTHVDRLYERVRSRRGHSKAIVAVARHLAEATFWILNKGEPYRPPKSSTQG